MSAVTLTEEVAYLSPKEAARFLSLSESVLERYRTNGGGPVFHKLGRRTVRYSTVDLRAWMDQFRCGNTAQAAMLGEAANV
jgi:predicted DNA-binding transcriptional regulator AlpA